MHLRVSMFAGSDVQAFADKFSGVVAQWGVDDCCMFPAKWVEHAIGTTPDVPEYKSEFGANRHIQRAGGLAPLFDRVLEPFGFMEDPYHLNPGDVGILQMSFGQVGAIHLAYGVWLRRTQDDVLPIVPNETVIIDGKRVKGVVKAWSIS